jgi:pimeloyl-ACP methyl ester carboxylesterase
MHWNMLRKEAKMLTEKSFDAGSVLLNYVEGPPSGRPLILLHGGTVRWQTFSTILPILSMRYHTYALDLRGHGLSGRTPGAYKTIDFAPDVERFLLEQVGEPAALLGWSLGADVALQVAAHHPDLVYAIILEDAATHLTGLGELYDPDSEFQSFLDRFRRIHSIITTDSSMPHIIKELAAWEPQQDGVTRRRRAKHLGQLDPEILLGVANNTMDEGYFPGDLLPKITCPVLLLHGDPSLGSLVEEHHIEWYESRLRDFTHVQVTGVGHLLHRPDAIGYVQHVIDFLEAL